MCVKICPDCQFRCRPGAAKCYACKHSFAVDDATAVVLREHAKNTRRIEVLEAEVERMERDRDPLAAVRRRYLTGLQYAHDIGTRSITKLRELMGNGPVV